MERAQYQKPWWRRLYERGPHKYELIVNMPENLAVEVSEEAQTSPASTDITIIDEEKLDATDPSSPDESVPPAPEPKLSKLCSCHVPHLGLIYAACSAFFLSLCSLLVKRLNRFEPAELATIRFVGILVPSLAAALREGHHLFPAGHRRLLVLRALLGTTSLVCKFYALRNMSLADASVILLSVPVFTAVFARVFLREPCGWLHGATIGLTVAGMVLITRPPALFGPLPLDGEGQAEGQAPAGRLLGSLLAVTSTMFGANVYVAMRLLKSVPPTVIMTNFSALAAPLSLCVCLSVGEFRAPRSAQEVAELAGLAACSFLGQLCLTRACRLEEAGLVAIVRTIVEVLLAVVWQVLQFGDVPTPLTLGGMALVTFSVVLVGLKKWVTALPEEARIRQRLSWLV